MYNRVIYRKNRWKRVALLLFLICFVIALVYLYHEYAPVFFYAERSYDSIILEASKRHHIDPDLVRAVICQESKFNANAVGTKGEIGLMQIRPEKGAVSDWQKRYNQELRCKGVLFRPELNIEIGTWYLSEAVKNWSGYKYQYELALSEYNAGRSGMREWVPDKFDGEVLEHITISSTKLYVKSIMQQFQKYAEKREVK